MRWRQRRRKNLCSAQGLARVSAEAVKAACQNPGGGVASRRIATTLIFAPEMLDTF